MTFGDVASDVIAKRARAILSESEPRALSVLAHHSFSPLGLLYLFFFFLILAFRFVDTMLAWCRADVEREWTKRWRGTDVFLFSKALSSFFFFFLRSFEVGGKSLASCHGALKCLAVCVSSQGNHFNCCFFRGAAAFFRSLLRFVSLNEEIIVLALNVTVQGVKHECGKNAGKDREDITA